MMRKVTYSLLGILISSLGNVYAQNITVPIPTSSRITASSTRTSTTISSLRTSPTVAPTIISSLRTSPTLAPTISSTSTLLTPRPSGTLVASEPDSKTEILSIGAILGICAAILVVASAVAIYFYSRAKHEEDNVSIQSMFKKKKAKLQDNTPPPTPPKIVMASPMNPSSDTLNTRSSDPEDDIPIRFSQITPSQPRNPSSPNQQPETTPNTPIFQNQQYQQHIPHSNATARNSVISVLPSMAYDPSMYQTVTVDPTVQMYQPGPRYPSGMSIISMTNGAMVGMLSPEGYIVPVMMPTAVSGPMNIISMDGSTPIAPMNLNSVTLPPTYEEAASHSESSGAQREARDVDVKVPIPTVEEIDEQLADRGASSPSYSRQDQA